MKRGQVTYFIIAGLIILIAVVLILVSRIDYIENLFDVQRSKLMGVANEVEPVKEYIEGCMWEIGNDAITLVMIQGGYLYPDLNPGFYNSFSSIDVAYWYYDQRDISPSVEEIARDVGIYVDEILPTCIDSAKNKFTEYKIEYEIISTDVEFKNDRVTFDSNINLDVEYKDVTYHIDNVISSFDSDSIAVFNSAKTLFGDIKKSKNNLNLNKDYDYNINFFYGDEGTIYSISSDDTMVNFAVNFIERNGGTL